MNGSQSSSYVASAFKLMQEQHLADPLLVKMEQEDVINQTTPADALSQQYVEEVHFDIGDAKEGDVIHFPGGSALVGKAYQLDMRGHTGESLLAALYQKKPLRDAAGHAVKSSAFGEVEKGVDFEVVDMDNLPSLEEIRARIVLGRDVIDKRLTEEGNLLTGAAGYVRKAILEAQAASADDVEPYVVKLSGGLQQLFDVQSSGEKAAVVFEDSDRVFDRWASLIKDAMPEELREPRSTERFRSEMEPVIMLHKEEVEEPQGRWEPAKVWTPADVHRQAPEGFELGPAALEEPEDKVQLPVTPMARHSIIPLALLDWLSVVSELPSDVSAQEITSPAGRQMLRQLRELLWFKAEDIRCIRSEYADALESLGYRVSYAKNTGLLMLELKSGAISWVVS